MERLRECFMPLKYVPETKCLTLKARVDRLMYSFYFSDEDSRQQRQRRIRQITSNHQEEFRHLLQVIIKWRFYFPVSAFGKGSSFS